MKMNKMLCLPPIPPSLDTSTLPVVYKSIATLGKREVEPAGKAFEDYFCRACGLDVADDSDKNAEKDAKQQQSESEDKKLREDWEKRHKERLKEAEFTEEEPDENLYEILGIGHLGFNASAKQIKRAYQKSILIHHPDKKQGKAPEEEENDDEDPMFLSVQRAYEILGNPKKRKGYDSTFDFDDSIPGGLEDFEDEQDFYDIFGPVFERNARFSEKKPVPLLGDSTKPIEDVHEFYQFWNKFESWREFSKFDEFKDGDLDDASCRAEKRWMIRQNESIRTKKKKKEYERLQLLVQRAMKRDPRLIREKAEEQARKEAAAAAKLEAKRRKEAEAAAEAERKAAEALEAQRIKKEKEAEQRRLRQARKKKLKRKAKEARVLCEEACECLSKSTTEKLQFLEMIDDAYTEAESEEALQPLVDAFGKVESTPITNEQASAGLANLEQAAAKLKSLKLQEQEANKRNVQSLLNEEKAKLEAKGEASKGPPWCTEELSVLAKAVKKFPGGFRRRWDCIAEYVNTNISASLGIERTRDQCIDKVKSFSQSTEVSKQKPTKKEAFESFKAKKEGKKAAVTETTEWTREEQSALEAALQKFPASLEKNERWRSIAAAVKTKTKKECVVRYKFLRAQILAQR